MSIHRRSRRIAVAVLAAGLGVLGLLVVLGPGGRRTPGGPSDGPVTVHLRGAPPPAPPAADLDWWAPVRGEPLGIAVDGADVAVAAYDEVRLLDLADGRPRWRTVVPGIRDHRPALGGDRVAVTGDAALVLLDRADGALVASVPFAGPGPVALVTTPGGRHLAVAGSATGSATGEILAVDAGDGTVLWSTSYPGTLDTAPQAAGPTVVALWHEPTGSTLRAFDPATGALRWEAPLGRVAGAPAVAGGIVVIPHGDSVAGATAHGLDAATGAERWQVPLAGWWDTWLEPAVGGGTAYLLDGMGTVVALDPGTGVVAWRRETGRPLLSARVVLTADAVVFNSYEAELMVLDRGDGRLRSAEPQSGVLRDLAVGGDHLVSALRLAAPSRVEARPAP